MTRHNDPLLGCLFYLVLGIAIWFVLSSCATVHEPEKVLCLEPCQIGNAVYKEEILGKDTYNLTINVSGFSPLQRVIAMQIFDLRKDLLTEELGYAICYTVTIQIASVYRIPVGTLDMFIIKGVIACQD